MKILACSGRVEVETEDGSTIYGDLIVGADGVHSRIRQEMQRIAAEDTPSADLFPESKGGCLCPRPTDLPSYIVTYPD